MHVQLNSHVALIRLRLGRKIPRHLDVLCYWRWMILYRWSHMALYKLTCMYMNVTIHDQTKHHAQDQFWVMSNITNYNPWTVAPTNLKSPESIQYLVEQKSQLQRQFLLLIFRVRLMLRMLCFFPSIHASCIDNSHTHIGGVTCWCLLS